MAGMVRPRFESVKLSEIPDRPLVGRELSPCGSARERPLCQIRSPQPARRRPAQNLPVAASVGLCRL